VKPLKSRTLNIMGYKWKLIVSRKPPPFKEPPDKLVISPDTHHGYCDRVGNQIWICNNDTVEHQYSTFIHELIHAIETINDIKLSEHKVLIFEAGLFQVLHANKIKLY